MGFGADVGHWAVGCAASIPPFTLAWLHLSCLLAAHKLALLWVSKNVLESIRDQPSTFVQAPISLTPVHTPTRLLLSHSKRGLRCHAMALAVSVAERPRLQFVMRHDFGSTVPVLVSAVAGFDSLPRRHLEVLLDIDLILSLS